MSNVRQLIRREALRDAQRKLQEHKAEARRKARRDAYLRERAALDGAAKLRNEADRIRPVGISGLRKR